MYATQAHLNKGTNQQKSKNSESVLDDIWDLNHTANNVTYSQTSDIHSFISEREQLKELQKKQEQLERISAIKDSTQQILQGQSSSLKIMEEDFAQLQEQNNQHHLITMNSIQKLKKQNKQYHDETMEVIKGVTTQQQKNHQQVITSLQQQKKESTAQFQRLRTSVIGVRNNITEVAEKISELEEEVRNESRKLSDDIREFQDDVSGKLHELQDDVSGQLNSFQENVSGQINSFQENVFEGFEEMNDKIQEAVEQMHEDDMDLDEDDLNEILTNMSSVLQCESGFDWNSYNNHSYNATCQLCYDTFSAGYGYQCEGGSHFICNKCITNHGNQNLHGGGGKKTFYVLGNQKLHLGQNGGNIDKFYDIQRFYNIDDAKKNYQNQIQNLGNFTKQKFHFATVLNQSKNGTISKIMSKKISIPKNIKYHYIINPENGKEVNINSNLGKQILHNYTEKITTL